MSKNNNEIFENYLKSIGCKLLDIVEDDEGHSGKIRGWIKTNNNKNIKKSGFYYVIDKKEMFWFDGNKEKDESLEILKGIENAKNKQEQASFKITTEDDLIKKSSSSENNSTSGTLNFSIKEDDNIIVKRLKELINSKNVRNEIISSKGYNYNVVYSLMKRKSIDFKTLEKWCDILGVTFDIVFKPRSSKF